MDLRPIGVFDSGVGGLSTLRAVQQSLPEETFLYFADQAHVPYGSRPEEEIRRFAEEITRFLLSNDVKMIVVACNTASGAALQHLRSLFPSTPFIGLEPAIGPAVRMTKTDRVAVLATEATLNAELYRSTRHLFATRVQVHEATLTGVVEEIEADRINGARTKAILEEHIPTLLARGVDTFVLGCTHYPFLVEQIRKIAGPDVNLIDPADQVASHISRTLAEKGLLASGIKPPAEAVLSDVPSSGKEQPLLFSTGDAHHLAALAASLAGIEGKPIQVFWNGNRLEQA